MTIAAPRIAVLGLGRLGACLARALFAAGVTNITLASRERVLAERVSASLSGAQALDVAALPDAAELLFLTVPDAQVQSVCESLQLSAAHAVVHLSGVLDLECLSSASARGARVGAMHPLQVFPLGAGAERFRGIHMGVEASDPALTQELEQIVHALGATAFSLAGVDRAAYHAAAVFASNYAVALHAAAAAVWERAGLPLTAARQALAPLTLGAAQALAERELPQALTGPIARGDVASVERHLRVLRADPERSALYRALGRELLKLPLGLGQDAFDELMVLLEEPIVGE